MGRRKLTIVLVPFVFLLQFAMFQGNAMGDQLPPCECNKNADCPPIKPICNKQGNTGNFAVTCGWMKPSPPGANACTQNANAPGQCDGFCSVNNDRPAPTISNLGALVLIILLCAAGIAIMLRRSQNEKCSLH